MTKNQTRNPDGTFGPKKDNTNDNNGEKPDNTNSDGFSIKFEEIQDEDTKNAVKKVLEENQFLKQEVGEVKKYLEKQEQREQAKLYEQQRSAKMERLRQLDHRLAEKHKDESDLDKIDLLIETANSFKTNFADYKKEKEEKEGTKQIMGYIDPNTGELV